MRTSSTEHAAVVDDVKHMKRLGIAPVRANVVEDLLNRPGGADGDVVGRHQPADGVDGI